MMRLLKAGTTFDFMGKRKVAFGFSIAIILAGLVSLASQGLSFGIDFTGGTLIELGYEQEADVTEIRKDLADNGFADATVQYFGNNTDILIRLAPREGSDSAALSNKAFTALSHTDNRPELRRVEFVGPQVGDELTEDGGLAMLYALIAILVYVAFRFEYRFAIGSIIALVHDVLITIGVFSIFQIEFDLPVLAAVLAVIGYSLNDTIVVFDRIRDIFRKFRIGDAEEIINISLNQTLTRTLVTSITTLLVLIALFVFGGEIISGFSLALIIGVVVGTYSSIYIASASLIAMGISKEDLIQVEKEGEEIDMP
jgi:preprotein translocase subunit SecF